MNVDIKFGTDGWRGVIAEDFTFDNLRMAAQAVADYLDEKGESKQVAVGYDRRFLSEDFAAAAAEVFAGNGLTVYLSPKACATPHVSYFVNRRNLPIGVMITASHNPYKYNGFKIKERFGGSASVETTKQIEALLGRNPVRTMSFREAKKISRIIETPLDEAYGELIESLVDIEAVRHSHLSVVIDSMNGVGEKLLEHWVGSRTCRVSTLRSDRDVLFAGRAPEPKEAYLDVLREAVVSSGADLGLATDGDGDRSGGVHADGSIFTPLEMIALLALYLIEYRKESGVIACTNANTQYLRKIAEANGIPYVNKPVGFKYIAEVMQKQELLIGGEESGGLTVKGYLPERDGVLINLLLLEMVVKTGKTTLQLLQDLYARFGEFHFRRKDFPVAPSKGKRQVAAISKTPPGSIAGIAVTSVDTLDGAKLFLQDGSWLLFRQSGTEPSLRVYTEAPSLEACDRLIEMGMKALGEADPNK